MKYRVVLLMLLMMLCSCQKTITAPDQPTPPLTYNLTDYFATCQGNEVIYLHAGIGEGDTAGIYKINLDGTNKKLILASYVELTFDWLAPDLLIVSDGTIYTVDMDSLSGTKPLTNLGTTYYFPSIRKSDGEILVDQPYLPEAGIWKMNSDGSGLCRIIPEARFPDWSADGQEIVGLMDYTKIIVTDTTGKIIREIQCQGFEVRSLKVSPDGSRIIFSLQTRGRAPQIWVMSFDGSGKQKLIKAGGDYPTWTKDGRIVFTNTTNGYLYIMDADGSDLKQITK